MATTGCPINLARSAIIAYSFADKEYEPPCTMNEAFAQSVIIIFSSSGHMLFFFHTDYFAMGRDGDFRQNPDLLAATVFFLVLLIEF